MAEQDPSAEKTEEPTPKKLADAKKKGQVARSKEANSMAIMMVGSLILISFGPGMIDSLGDIFKNTLSLTREQIFDTRTITIVLVEDMLAALFNLMPLLLIMLLVALATPMIIGGWVFSTSSMSFKWNKLDPIKGIARIFGVKGLVELIKALGKVIVVGTIAYLLLFSLQHKILGLAHMTVETALAAAGEMFVWSLLLMSSGLLLIAAIDIPFQLFQHNKQLKMTKQEIRDEFKETEGKPEVKQKIRQLQQQASQARMMDDVPKADVIITNPEHFAIAISYKQDTMRTPILVAKGVDKIAVRIKHLAHDNEITIVESPLLARALYASTDLQKEIPAELYLAVAQVLAFVFQLAQAKKNRTAPPPPPAADVPSDFVAILQKRYPYV